MSGLRPGSSTFQWERMWPGFSFSPVTVVLPGVQGPAGQQGPVAWAGPLKVGLGRLPRHLPPSPASLQWGLALGPLCCQALRAITGRAQGPSWCPLVHPGQRLSVFLPGYEAGIPGKSEGNRSLLHPVLCEVPVWHPVRGRGALVTLPELGTRGGETMPRALGTDRPTGDWSPRLTWHVRWLPVGQVG